MAWKSEKVEDNGLVHVYAWENDDKSKRKLVYTIDKNNKEIKFFPKGEFPTSVVSIEGFEDLPQEFSSTGYIKSGLEYYINKKLDYFRVDSLTISKEKESSFKKLPKRNVYRVVLNYKTFAELKSTLTGISSDAATERSSYVDEFFHNTYPKKFKKVKKVSAKVRARRLVNSLDNNVISELSPKDIDKLMDFLTDLITKRYTSAKSRLKLLKSAKVQIDKVAINDVVTRFEELLNNDVSEAMWGEFLQQNLFLVESKYVAVIPELNVMLASQRKVDFGLVDIYGYLDIFEIKKASTKLLSANTDRGNYYWNTETSKAIAQAEKYLYNAERKATALREDIIRERNTEVAVIKPKVVLIVGSSKQLKNAAMREDFRILRGSLKNVEIILYDEMLSRLKNQLTKIYSTPDIKLKKSLGKK